MCGIAGFVGHGGSVAALQSVADAMASTLEHRGPDGSGIWVDADIGIALAHRRLAIIDLTPSGAQPMTSRSGRFITVYNGEIYNFRQLRAELERRGCRFSGHSDTEVILAGMEEWGVDEAIRRLCGMFAIAVWDRVDRCLVLIRDRLGEKPLYYGHIHGGIVFASELKALRAHPSFEAAIDRQSVSGFLRYGYVPGPGSIYKGVHKLPAGSSVVISLSSGAAQCRAPIRYWSVASTFSAAARAQFRGSADEAMEALQHSLRSIVRQRMISDVPLGAFLSGGVDSSLIVALMQRESSGPVRTFTIGYPQSEFDESPFAAEVANILGTRHTRLEVSWQDALGLVPQLPNMFDEPFADSSQIPTHLLAKLTRNHVTVALSGDGGDEVFGGYNRYFWWPKLGVRSTPRWLRAAVGRAIVSLPATTWDRSLRALRPMLPANLRYTNPGERIHKLAPLLAATDPSDLYEMMISQCRDTSDLAEGGSVQIPREGALPLDFTDIEAVTSGMMQRDLEEYLPDDILVKVDRATMAASLETRAPFLDHDLIQFSASLPLNFNVGANGGKGLLKRLLKRYIPEVLVNRPKSGFAVPIDQWLRGPLRDWARDLLAPSFVKAQGLLRPEGVQSLWIEYQNGRRQCQHLIWSILMLQAWGARWQAGAACEAEPLQ